MPEVTTVRAPRSLLLVLALAVACEPAQPRLVEDAALAPDAEDVAQVPADAATRDVAHDLPASRDGGVDVDVAEASTLDRPVDAARGTCEQAVPLEVEAPALDQACDEGVEVLPPCDGLGFREGGGVRYYTVRAGPRELLDVTAAPTPGSPARTFVLLRAYDGCPRTRACLASAGNTTSSPAAMRLRNDSDAPRSFLLAVASAEAVPGVRFDLRLARRSGASNASCAHPMVLTPATPLRAQDLSLATGGRGTCGYPGRAHETLYYRAMVPSDQVLTVRATPAPASMQFAVSVLSGCDGDCLAAGGNVDRMPVVARWANGGAGPREVVVAVSALSTGGGVFDVEATLAAPAAASRCEMAPEVQGDTVLDGIDPSGAILRLDYECGRAPVAGLGTSTWRVALRPGETLEATPTLTPGLALAPILRVMAGCEATTCLAVSTRGGPTHVVRYTNPDATTRSVILAVSHGGVIGTGALRVAVRVR